VSPRILIPVLFLVAAAFAPALLGGYVYDDLIVVERATRIAETDGWSRLLFEPFFGSGAPYWRPLASSLLVLGDGIGGPTGIHALALLLHLGAVTAAFGIARELGLAPIGAGLAALLFGVHPVQVESVAWASALNDVLYGGLSLAAIWATLRWRRRGAIGLPWLALSLTLLALLAKENALVTPLLVVAAAVLSVPGKPRERSGDSTGNEHDAALQNPALAGPSRKSRLIRTVLPGLLVLAILLRRPDGGLRQRRSRPRYRPDRPQHARRARYGRAFWVCSELLLTLIWPWPMTPFRTVPLMFDPAGHVFRMYLLLFATVGLLAWLKRRPGTWLLAALLLAPILLVTVRFNALGAHPVSDRYLYPAVFFPCGRARFWAQQRRPRQLALLLLALGFAALSAWQCTRWQSQQSLIAHGMRFAPRTQRSASCRATLCYARILPAWTKPSRASKRHCGSSATSANRSRPLPKSPPSSSIVLSSTPTSAWACASCRWPNAAAGP
jgi:hypothetical protein